MASEIPPLPPGFVVDEEAPPLPPGFTLDGGAQSAQPQEQKRNWREILGGVGKEAGRQLGLTARYAVEGAAAIPAAFAAPINRALGLPDPAQALSSGLTDAGLPQPQSGGERVVGDVSRALVGAGGSMGAGSLLQSAASPVSRGVGNILTSQPAVQAGSAVVGAGASGVTREAGGGPGAQLAAGLGGAFAVPIVNTGAGLVNRGGTNMVRPITKSGQQQIASDILASNADDPARAAANLRASQSVIPGSGRTAGEASKDVGLMTLEKGVRGKNTAAFGQRISEQNTARQEALAKLAGNKSDIAAAEEARKAATTPMREAAFASGKPSNIAPVHKTIDDLLAAPSGKRETISSVLKWAKTTIGDEVDPATLYEKRKDLQLAMQGKLQPSSKDAPNASTLGLARKELGQVVKSLDDSIEASAPGFKAYLARFSELSKPIDQKKILQEISRRAQLQSMDTTTQEQILGAASFGRAVDAALIKNQGKLTAAQLEQLSAIRTDLQYGQAINSSLIKAPGSDTFQNLSIAQVIGSGSSPAHPALRIIGKPLQWLYKLGGTDEAVNELLSDAMLDPKLAASMLEKATPKSVETFMSMLVGKARAGALGAQAQLIASPPQKPKDRDSQSQQKAVAK